MNALSEIYNSTAGSIAMFPGPLILFKLKSETPVSELERYLFECISVIERIRSEFSDFYMLLDTGDIRFTDSESFISISNFLAAQLTNGIKINAMVVPQNITARWAIENMLKILKPGVTKNLLFQSQEDAVEAICKMIRHTPSPTVL
jgi:hypothetical protein